MRAILLFAILSFSLSAFSQVPSYAGQEVLSKSSYPKLSQHFKSWNIYQIPTADIFNQVKNTNGESRLQLNLGDEYEWDLSLFKNEIRSSNYFTKTSNGEILSSGVSKTFEGYEQSLGGNVRLTIDSDFFYGYVESGGERYFIEPVWYFDKSAPKNLFVVYDEHKVIPNKNATCGAEEMHNHTHRMHQNKESVQRSVGLCFDVEVAIASDFLMFQKYNTVAAVENHNIAVLNNVQGNYDDEFADELNFVVVTQFVATTAASDPWTNSTNAGTLLNNFRSWGNGGNFGVTYDVASLWTDRDLDGTTIGIAYLGGTCTNSRYNVLQDFSTTAWRLRVLTSHEFGHNFDAVHDAAGSGFIMAPAVNNTTQWSPTSVNDINAFITSANCLQQCAPPVPPVASFGSNLQSICEGNSVHFYDQSTGVVDSWAWTFTGGTPSFSTVANPVVTYSAPGSYPVSLTVTNPIGSNTSTQSGFIIVGPGGTNVILYDDFENGLNNWSIENPNNNITWALSQVGGSDKGNSAAFMDNWTLNGSGERDGLVSGVMDFSGYTTVNLTLDYSYTLYLNNLNFQDSLVIKLSTDGGNTFPTTLFADADDGSTWNFVTREPSNSEFTPAINTDWCYAGTFGAGCISLDLNAFVGETNVVLKIENVNDFGNNLYIDNILVSSDCQILLPPETDFIATPTTGCDILTTTFTDLSTNSPTSWSWSFPGGNPSSSTAQNPTVTYGNPGTYEVTLTTTNMAGSDTETKVDYIEVRELPVANFNYTLIGNVAWFENLSTGGPTTYNWTFGDGNSSTEEEPIHAYTGDGVYDVTLFVSNECGISSVTQQITINTQPIALFVADVTSGCAPLTVNFTDQSSNAASYNWTITGATPNASGDPNPTVTYNTPGVYTVSLTITTSSGLQDTYTLIDYITVSGAPTSDFSSTTNGQTVTFTNNSTNATSYLWDFGDGTTSTDTNPMHTYSSDGMYTVTLSATNDCGTVTSTQTVTISSQPTAGFNANITSGCADLTVQFNDMSSTNTTNWSWTFNGGNPSSSTDQNPTVTYTAAGVYSVTLVASNASGSNTFTLTDYIVVDDVPSVGFSQSINNQTVTFTNNSSNATSYSWDFGDGNTSTETNPIHTYSSDGAYTVTLTATNNCGSVTSTQTINVSTLPTAGFNSNITSGCADLMVQFNDMSSTNTTSWSWTFNGGNPSSSTDQNPTVTYTSAGTYSVTLVASNASGSNTFTLTDYIVVDDVPSVGFSQNINNQTVTFTNNSTNANSYSWDFGDGNTSTETNPVHTYGSDGAYTVTLTATNNCGSVTFTQTINVSTLPTAGFNSNITSGCADLMVQFNDMSSINTTSWSWTFNGGNPSSSTDQNPTVTYTSAGTYSVTLVASNASGNNTFTLTDYIVVDDVPFVGFSQDVNNQTVTFTNNSTNANSYSWDFGDGNTSTETNPVHTYGSDDAYTVTLTATNNCGSVTFTQTINVSTLPTAGFNSNITNGCADLTVQFNDMSSTNTTSWSWTFNGGNPSSSTDQNPTVIYTSAGTYSVTLVASNASGSNTFTLTDYIVVDDVPSVGFSQNINNQTVTFTNNSTNANSYSWDFGDGNTSTETNPVHTYGSDGVYTVTLTATNNCGSVTFTQTINVSTLPTAGFNSNVTSGCADLTVQFNDMSSTNTTSWSWTFNGGNPSSSTDQNPTVTYAAAGVYSVTLVASNASGNNTFTLTDYIVVDDVPSAGFLQSINNQTVTFTNNSSNATSYLWDFGDGNTSTETNPVHTYGSDGAYTVILTATNNCGSVTSTQTINVSTLPTAGFNSNVTSGCADLTVQFNDMSSTNTTNWLWTFEGGNPSTSTDQNPTVTYTSAGVYTVTLEASNGIGSNTFTLTDYIEVSDVPSANFDFDINGPLVNFENQSANATSYFWDFGDGTTSTDPNPEHQYAVNSDYVVTMNANNSCGTTTVTQVVSITSSIIAGFSSNTITGCMPLSVQFFNESVNSTSVLWSFTGGTPANSTLENPVVTYENAGVYTVMLEAINPTGSSTIVETGYIVVESLPLANFATAVNNLTASFTNQSAFADNYFWDFGDGTTSTDENPDHTYSEMGVYSVTLEVSNDCGTNSFTFDVNVGTAVSAGFSAESTQGCAPLEIQFTNESSNNVTGWNWSFPGGNPSTSTEANPTVIYENAGVYSVILEVSNSFTNNTVTQTDIITVFDVPSIAFSSNVSEFFVTFSNSSTNADSYLWSFGDGTTSTAENPEHTYNQDGTYNVILEATNSCGTVTTQESISIVTSVTAGFSADVTNGCAGLMVQFLDNSSENVTEWNWSFPGGNPSTSTDPNPLVTYNTPGVYEVTLMTNNSQFNASFTETNYIIIEDVPTAAFTSNSMGADFDFNNTSTNATSYVWDFGDGNTSTDQNPTHTYGSDGEFCVTLTATNACGSVSTENCVTAVLAPVANFSIENLVGCAPITLEFLDQSSSNTTSWLWTFEGGSPNNASVQNPAITFDSAGTFDITLEVSNAAGSSTFTMEIILDAPPVVDFSSDVNILTTTFTNMTTNATSYSWDFGDNNMSSDENPIHNYAAAGNYTVVLSATNACGTTTYSQQVEVLGPEAIASFATSSVDGCAPFTVDFEDTSTGAPFGWAWEFPGGNPATSSEQHPTVVYNNMGTYDVSLTVTNPVGENTITQTSFITVGESPTADFTSSIDVGGLVNFVNSSALANSYEWTFGDGTTSTEEAPIHTYDSTGTYTIQLLVTNECGTDSMSQEIFVQITSIDEVSFLEKFELFPNPNNGQFTLNIEGQPLDELQIRLFNILGQSIFEERIDFSSGKFLKNYQLQDLPAAAYILQIKSEQQLVHRRIVKE